MSTEVNGGIRMKKQTVVAAISSGKEERPVAELVHLAGTFSSSIYLETENKMINAKSIMGMMTLDLLSGIQVTISADGEDEEDAIATLSNYLEGRS